jgi:hypothetical protein
MSKSRVGREKVGKLSIPVNSIKEKTAKPTPGKRRRPPAAPMIDFRAAKPYWCRRCRRYVAIRPCPACMARGPGGWTDGQVATWLAAAPPPPEKSEGPF